MLSTSLRAASRPSQTQTPYSSAFRVLLAGGLAISLVACAPASVTNNGGDSGGSKGSGGSAGSGGSNSGGTTAKGGSGGGSGGSGGGSGGSNSGGTTAKGGSGGSGGGSGGSNSGGTAKGGSGGSGGGSGGSNSGGSNSGGTAAGGTAAGGTAAGGTAAGGTAGGGAGGTSTGDRPKGYFKTSDWSVSSVDWHGCVWTGKDCESNCGAGITPVPGSTTTVTPQDFMSGKDGGPYQISGTVHNSYEAVALLGFNLNEAPNGKADQCKYDPTVKDGPPTATIPSGATGIAVNWSAKVAPVTSFRIQIQGVKGATDENNRWCATIADASGPSFVPFSAFNTKCWDNSGNKYNNEPIDAVVFLVPGTTTSKAPFDFTIVGFAPGTSKADAPGGAVNCGEMTGSVGSTTASVDASMQRAAVTGKDCKKYIVQNNNWGNQTGSIQILDFVGNSFTVKDSTGNGGDAPASFPSIYVGANGQIANGTFNTWDDTGLPKTIGNIGSAQTSFEWSGGGGGKNFNACYDVWFAKSSPKAGSYDDAVSGFLMVWLYKPGSKQPIGSVKRTASIAGHNWDVWVGPRGNTKTGTDDANRPVVSYVSKDGSLGSLSFDLKAFMADAVANASADQSAGGTSQAFSNSWYLTDVFAGFEIWTGSDGKGLKETFSIAVK